MNSPLTALTLALFTALALPEPTIGAPWSQPLGAPDLDVSLFYEGLSSYGDWVELQDYGWTFAPRVDRSWRPYTRGQWIYTDDGWYWDSDEDFGWATYHYGRWVNDRNFGWVWVPGTEWAPAWVSWRRGNGYTGWAPLPPRAIWQSRVGFRIGGIEIDAYVGSGDYAFVPDRSFMDRGLYQRVVPSAQNLTIINVTHNVTDYGVVNDRIVNRGVPVGELEQSLGRRIPRTRTVEVSQVDGPRRSMTGIVTIYRPSVKAAPERRPTRGRSLVRGEAPSPLLVARRSAREQERRQGGGRAEATAKDAAQHTQGTRAKAEPPKPEAAPRRKPTQAQPKSVKENKPHREPKPRSTPGA